MDILNCIIKKGKKGFSLAELLIAVGILSVLIAIGFPAVIYFNARLNQTKLDNSARDVFLAAQNKLTAIKSSGREMPEGKSMGKTPPSDFSLTGLEWNNTGNDDTDEYVYVENGDAGFTFMDDTMFGNGYEDGQFIIEFNRHTGHVYAVFYWEGQAMDYGGVSKFVYPENYNSFVDSEGAEQLLRGGKYKSNRMKLKVGYYGANGVEGIGKAEVFDYNIEVINSDELQLVITPEKMDIGRDTEYEVTISSATDSANTGKYIYRVMYRNGAPYSVSGSSSPGPVDVYKNVEYGLSDFSFTITLDSLEADKHFAYLHPQIASGDDIDINVHAIYVGTKGIYTEETQKKAQTNSLFAGLRLNIDKTVSAQGKTVNIENGRHLQNLSHEASNFGFAGTAETPYPVESAGLSADIDWSAYNDTNTLWNKDAALESFYPISNEKTGLVQFDGTNHTISNLTVTQYSTGKIAKDKSGSKDEVRAAGLFGIVYDDFTIKDLKLYESFVKVSGSSGIKVHAAAVAGFFGSSAGDTHSVSNITNVECTDCTVSADGNAGMFAGQVKLADNIGTSKDGKDGGTPIADGVFITDCRAYLSDDNSDEYYQLESGDERNYYVKSSASSAGGIAGYVEYGNLELDDSFSAVNVYAQMNAGGLVGASNDKLYIFNCYSSCDITSVSETGSGAGGILGKFGRGWIKIDNCFTTCDIYANCYSGGAFGFFTGSRLYKSATVRVKNTYSYGAVTWRNREICTLDENMVQGESFSGGFIGRIDKSLLSLDSSALDMRDHCYYLCMRGYNNSNPGPGSSLNGYGAVYDSSVNGGKVHTAPALYENEGTGAEFMPPADSENKKTYAYSKDFKGLKFPFKMIVCGDRSVLDYHGNWPKKGNIETALCYYEKYEKDGVDTQYGYFAVTTIGMGQSAWTLDTLKSQEELDSSGYCLTEDGYALISAYKLERFSFVFDGDIESTMDSGDIEVKDEGEATVENAVIIEKGIHLSFSQSDAESLDMYADVYRLPFKFQEMSRDKAMEFYDRLDISYTAEEKYSGDGATTKSLDLLVEEIQNRGDGTPIPPNWHQEDGRWTASDSFTFYYCCHFAKTAINPYIGRTAAHRPVRTHEVYVRSARQFNAIGRYCYYWNGVNNSKWNKYQFEQELDLNFSTYTRNYCQTDYFMTPGGNYENIPIGRTADVTQYWDGEKLVDYSNFQNDYDGNGHSIINFKMETESLYYVGLFGEIYGSTIENLNMRVDDELAKKYGDYNDEYGAGYIIATYTYNKLFAESGGKSNADTQAHNYGLGGLVGKTTSGASTGDTNNPLIVNCSVSGYTLIGKMSSEKEYYNPKTNITYKLNVFPKNLIRNYAFHVGGLVGFNNSYIFNCTAENKLVKFVYAHPWNNSNYGYEKTVGGFAGSNQGVITGCYAGGKLEIDYDRSNSYGIESAKDSFYIGGFSGTNCYPGFGYERGFTKYSNASATYAGTLLADCYSFSTIEKSDTVNRYVPDENIYGVTYTLDTNTAKEDYSNTIKVYNANDVNMTGSFVNIPENVSNCYYLADTIKLPEGIYPSDRDFLMAGDKKAEQIFVQMSSVADFANTLNAGLDSAGPVYNIKRGEGGTQFVPYPYGSESLSAAASWPYTAALFGKSFPFAPVVTENKAYVHYGDWPDYNAASAPGYGLCYYEKYVDTTDTESAGFYVRGIDPSVFNGGDMNDINTAGTVFYDTLEYDTETDKRVYQSGYCYAVPKGTVITGAIPDTSAPENPDYDFYVIGKEEPVEVGCMQTEIPATAGLWAVYNPDFGAAIKLSATKLYDVTYASDRAHYDIRTFEQLKNMGEPKYPARQLYSFEQTMNIESGEIADTTAIPVFNGVFNGKGSHRDLESLETVWPEESYTINIDMKNASASGNNLVGLIGRNLENSVLKNIRLEGGILCTTENSNYDLTIGALTAVNKGTITGCISRADIKIADNTSSGLGKTCIGGLIGRNENAGNNKCFLNGVEADIVCDSTIQVNNGQGMLYLGGFVGYSEPALSTNYVRGRVGAGTRVIAKNQRNYMGGFAGYTSSPFEACFFEGEMGKPDRTWAGQFIGYLDIYTVVFDSCYGWTYGEDMDFIGAKVDQWARPQFNSCYAYGEPFTDGGLSYIKEWNGEYAGSLGKIYTEAAEQGWGWAFDEAYPTPYFKKQ